MKLCSVGYGRQDCVLVKSKSATLLVCPEWHGSARVGWGSVVLGMAAKAVQHLCLISYQIPVVRMVFGLFFSIGTCVWE